MVASSMSQKRNHTQTISGGPVEIRIKIKIRIRLRTRGDSCRSARGSRLLTGFGLSGIESRLGCWQGLSGTPRTGVHDNCDALPGGRHPASPGATSGYLLSTLRVARGWQPRQPLGGGLSFSARADSPAARRRSSSALRTTGPAWGGRETDGNHVTYESRSRRDCGGHDIWFEARSFGLPPLPRRSNLGS